MTEASVCGADEDRVGASRPAEVLSMESSVSLARASASFFVGKVLDQVSTWNMIWIRHLAPLFLNVAMCVARHGVTPS